MNQNSSTDLSAISTAEAISRRAYEIWEREGRPEGCEMRHWLQAEQELGSASNSNRTTSSTSSNVSTPTRDSDITPLPGTRAASVVSAGRDSKRPPTPTPVPSARNGSGGAGRRKSPGTPPL